MNNRPWVSACDSGAVRNRSESSSAVAERREPPGVSPEGSRPSATF
ncbi:hypothetical protein RB13202 [Rhodopirellula baltica SH 1]|uniref:Uncharacterized protein n=1 Tax=Rhodopirellula baltica (strain DSM 10527 / NCIMB 13988 / SH1) TaxID=243090 RepID=Q7UHH4_RHOBA|nr:hypothetical protein RB13202 [Rhodopirellula baltica SH 1]